VASTQASIKVIKQFNYRGQTHQWSNRYYLNNTSIDTQAHFNTLADAVVLAEKAIYNAAVTIIGVNYYAPGSEVAVWTRSYSTAGTYATTTGTAPGDCAALIRYTTSQRTSKNHPLYLFNYYHGIVVAGYPNQDQVGATQATALGTYANSWVSGFSDGVTTYKKAGPRGAVATGYVVESYVTHRDFPR
jgi:hypothetical protein